MRTSNQKLLLIFLNFHLIRIQIHYLHLDRKRRFLIFKFLTSDLLTFLSLPHRVSRTSLKYSLLFSINIQTDPMTPWIYGWKMSAKINLISVWESSWRLMAFTQTSKWYVDSPKFCDKLAVLRSDWSDGILCNSWSSCKAQNEFINSIFLFFASSICVFRPFIPLFHNSLVYIFLV